jgi:D-alanine-D-alanine ligase
MKTYENIHVMLLKGGNGSERAVSLNSATECAKVIKQIGYKITEVDIAENNISGLSQIGADICFNALHGDYGEDGSIQGYLNLLKIPYTHSGVATSSIAMNKINFKRIITDATKFSSDPIYFPKTLQIKNNGKYFEVNYDGAFVVKPVKGGSSVGVTIVKKGNKVPQINETINKQLMAEIFVGSKELTVTVLKETPLCVTEIKTANDEEFYNYKAKYDKNGSYHKIPADIPKVIYKKALSWALKAHQIIGCRGISRTDFRYDANNEKLYMLELNTQPGMTQTSLSPEQASYCGINMDDMIKILMEEANYEC